MREEFTVSINGSAYTFRATQFTDERGTRVRLENYLEDEDDWYNCGGTQDLDTAKREAERLSRYWAHC